MAQKAGYQGIKKLIPPLDITTEGTMFVDMGDILSSIAPTEAGDKFSSPYNVGDEFYLADGKLYKATKQIVADDNIIIYPTENYNCQLVGTVTEQLNGKQDKTLSAQVEGQSTVEGALGALSSNKMSYADNGVLGAKNFIPTIDFDTITDNGVTFTNNYDGTFTVDSAGQGASANYNLTICSIDWPEWIKLNTRYRLSGTPTGSSGCGCYLNNSSPTTVVENGTPVDFSLSSYPSAGTTNKLRFGVLKDAVFNNMVVKPMICLASDSDYTWQPPAQTNRQLTVNKVDNSVIAPVENGTTASQAYSANDLFIRNGKIGKAKTTILQGETFTLNTNYEETTICELITGLLNS